MGTTTGNSDVSKGSAPVAHPNGVLVMPLPHNSGELPASIPAGYPADVKPRGFDGVHRPDAQNTDATPQFYYNQPGYQDLQGQPAPVAQGTSVGPMAPGAPLYCPPNQDGPTFLGATVGHDPILIHCGTCGYQGMSHVMNTRGWAHGMWGLMTLGLGLLCHVAMDTHHFCPQCKRHVADAKYM
ncbi:g10540 [Coccomyxa elongata]